MCEFLGKTEKGLNLDELAVSELIEFFRLLDKWDREAKQDPKAIAAEVADQRRDSGTHLGSVS
jgi:hypothetical protein